jgi:hypothetical protein
VTINIKNALTKRVRAVLGEFVDTGLLKPSNFDAIKGSLLGITLDDDTDLFLVLTSMLSLKYIMWTINTDYHDGKVLLGINSQRRLDSLESYDGAPICSSNDKLLINLTLSVSNLSNTTSLAVQLDITHGTPDKTFISISPYSIELDRLNSELKMANEEFKVAKLWTLACDLYS